MNAIEYLLIPASVVVTLVITKLLINRSRKRLQVKPSQTKVFSVITAFLDMYGIRDLPPTQTSKFEDDKYIRVLVVDSQAYWIVHNTLFVADQVDGLIDKETTRPVDTMAMDKVQLDRTIFIVNALTEGEGNDNWDSRN